MTKQPSLADILRDIEKAADDAGSDNNILVTIESILNSPETTVAIERAEEMEARLRTVTKQLREWAPNVRMYNKARSVSECMLDVWRDLDAFLCPPEEAAPAWVLCPDGWHRWGILRRDARVEKLSWFWDDEGTMHMHASSPFPWDYVIEAVPRPDGAVGAMLPPGVEPPEGEPVVEAE